MKFSLRIHPVIQEEYLPDMPHTATLFIAGQGEKAVVCDTFKECIDWFNEEMEEYETQIR